LTTDDRTPRPTADKPLRADARRNRELLLEVAEQVFTEHGPGASTEEVARVANVGIATVFRHFPTKEALLQAVLVRRLEKLREAATSMLGEREPGAAFFAFLDLVVDHSPVKNAFAQALAQAGIDVQAATSEAGQGLRDTMAVLLADAQRAGAVRPEVELPDLVAILIGAGAMLEHLADHPASARRALTVVVDGLRPRPTA